MTFKKCFPYFCCCIYVNCFQTQGLALYQTVPEVDILMPECWDYMCAPPCPVFAFSFIPVLSNTALAWDIWLLWNGSERKLFEVISVTGWKTWKYLLDSERPSSSHSITRESQVDSWAQQSDSVSEMIWKQGTLPSLPFPALTLNSGSWGGV